MSVLAGQSSITRGKTATYTVQVSTENGSASDVSVALTAQPSSQKPRFTSGCTKGDGTPSCAVRPVTTTQPANLDAQIAVASNATSVTSVKLTATASIVSTVKWTPPAAAATTSVTSPATATPPSPKAPDPPATAPPVVVPLPALSLGPMPNLNAELSLLIGTGDVGQLFPTVTPVGVPSASPVADPQAGSQNAEPAADSSAVPPRTADPIAQMVGLAALGLPIMLIVVRRSRRKRHSARRTDS